MVICHRLITYFKFFVSAHLLSASVVSGSVEKAEQNAFTLQFDNRNIHFNKSALTSFLDCLAGKDTTPCEATTLPSNTSEFWVEKNDKKNNGKYITDAIQVLCEVNPFLSPSGNTLQLKCKKSEGFCNLKIEYENKIRTRYETYEIRWEKAVLFISNTLDDITVEVCGELS
ncbi:unnamed protein product, partial [Lymnaea stagnalis]